MMKSSYTFAEAAMLQTDPMVQGFPTTSSPVRPVESHDALGLAWNPGLPVRPGDPARATVSEGLQWLVAVSRVEQAVRDACAQQNTFCRVMFRCQDGWTVLDMKALARHARGTFDAHAQGFADRFETDRTRQHVWVELTW